MQTVLDIIRHYSGAGEEDKDMEHKCAGTEENKVEIESAEQKWYMYQHIKSDSWSYYDSEFQSEIAFCPYCGAKLDES